MDDSVPVEGRSPPRLTGILQEKFADSLEPRRIDGPDLDWSHAMVSKDAVEAYAEFLERLGDGEVVDFQDLLDHHPGLAPDLERLHRRRADLERGLFAPRPRERSPADQRAAVEALRPTLRRFQNRTGFRRRYRLLGQVEEGGMGRVVRVFDRDLRRVLAMKLLASPTGPATSEDGLDAPRAARLLEEAQVTAQLDHPSIPPVHEVGLTPEGELYFTMKWIASERTLADVIASLHAPAGSEEWTLPRVLSLVQRAGEAVAFAHAHGVIHRDLKPANVLVGDMGEVYVTDWGVALALGSRPTVANLDQPEARARAVRTQRADRKRATPSTPLRTLEGHTVGTPEYMAPEQAHARIEDLDARTDVYSMGALLLHLLTGRAPKPLISTREVRAWLARSPLRMPAELEAIVTRAMAPAPRDRYPDMRALVRDLAAFQEGRVVAAYRTGALVELQKWVGRNKGMAVASVAALVALVMGLWFILQANQAKRVQLLQHARAQVQLASMTVDRGDANARLALATVQLAQRNWEWRHLLARSDSSRSSIATDAGLVHSFLSPEGDLFALTSSGTILRSVAEDRSLEPLVELGEEIIAADWSRDGRWVATVGRAHLGVFDVADGSLHPRLGSLDLPEGNRRARSLAFSPDGQRLATLAADARLRIFGLEDDSLRELSSTGTEMALAWIDTERLVCAGSEGRLRVWNTVSGRPEREWKVPGIDIRTPLTSLATHPPSERIVVGEREGGIWMWSAQGEIEGYLAGHEEAVIALAFDPEGTRIASGSADHAVRLWDPARRTAVATWAGHAGPVVHVAFDPSGTQVVTASEDRTVRVWSVDQEPGLTTLGAALYPLWCLSFSPDSRRIAVGSTARDLSIWDVASAQRIATLRGHKDRINAVRWSPDGRILVSASADDTLSVWDVATRSRLRVLEGHADDVTGLDIATPEARCVSSSRDGTLRSWDWTTGESTLLFEDDAEFACVAVSRDGKQIAAGTHDGRLLFGRKGALRFFAITTKPIVCLAFSPDGRLALGGDSGLFLWDPEEKRVQRHWFPFDVIEGVDFSLDGTRLASAALDSKVVRLCDPERDEPVASFGVPSRLYDLAFSHDDEARIATVDGNGKLRLWETSAPAALEPQRRAPREQAMRLEPLKQRLFDEHLRLDEVLRAVDALPGLPVEDRRALRTLAEARGDDAAETASEAFELILSCGDSESYRLAHQKLELACELEPNNRLWPKLLGAAQARLGQFDAALESIPDRAQLNDPPHIRRVLLAMRALSLTAVGRRAEAEAHAQELRELVAVQVDWADDPRVAELVADVEEALNEAPR